MQPAELVRHWVAAFNDRDIERLAELCEDDAVNHQAPEQPVRGRAAIARRFSAAFAEAEMVCEVENIFSDGDWAILEWKDPLGLRGCGFFDVPDGKIRLQRGYRDMLSFLKVHGLALPDDVSPP